MATLAGRLQPDNPKKENVELALAAVAGVTALDVVCGASLARHARPKPRRRLTAMTSAADPASGNRLSR